MNKTNEMDGTLNGFESLLVVNLKTGSIEPVQTGFGSDKPLAMKVIDESLFLSDGKSVRNLVGRMVFGMKGFSKSQSVAEGLETRRFSGTGGLLVRGN
jgi:hypothetical protein